MCPSEVSLTGLPGQVIDALEQLKARGLVSTQTTAALLGGPSALDDDGSTEPTDQPEPPKRPWVEADRGRKVLGSRSTPPALGGVSRIM
jgi:hypothetical protein